MPFSQFAAARSASQRARSASTRIQTLLALFLIASLLLGCGAPALPDASVQHALHASARLEGARFSTGRLDVGSAPIPPARGAAQGTVVLPTLTPTLTSTLTPNATATPIPTRLPTRAPTHTPTATATLAPITERSGGPQPPLGPAQLGAGIPPVAAAPTAQSTFSALPDNFFGTIPPAEDNVFGGSAPALPDVEAPVGLAAVWEHTENFLLLGTDRTPGATSWRTDSIVIVGLDRANNRAVLFSVPRDLYLQIPGYGWGRINQIDFIGEQREANGGPQLLGEVIEATLGIPIDHWARVHMDGFVSIIDALGGVTITLEEDFYEPIMRTGNEFVRDFHLPAGENHLDGATAYLFVRLRRAGTDIGRSARQRAVIWAIRDQILSTDTLTRLPELYTTFQDTVASDLGVLDLLGLAQVALTLDTNNVHSGALTMHELQNHVTASGAQVLVMPDPLLVRAAVEAVWTDGAPRAAESFLGGGSPSVITPTPTPLPSPAAQATDGDSPETSLHDPVEGSTESPADDSSGAANATPIEAPTETPADFPAQIETPQPEDAPALLPTVTPVAGA